MVLDGPLVGRVRGLAVLTTAPAALKDGRGGLSRREPEILRLVAAGHTNREIARDLYLSTRTVGMHVRHILDKLDCRSRAEATHCAGELGLLVEGQPLVERAV